MAGQEHCAMEFPDSQWLAGSLTVLGPGINSQSADDQSP